MSAIIIVLNGERFIEEAMISVVRQTFTDWELIVVDDGSTDGTRARVEHAMAADSRIRLLQHPDNSNHGMSASRNLGIATSTGCYIGFLDADDVWLPSKLAEQCAILEANPETAMVYGRTLMWHSWETGAKREDYCCTLGVESDRTYAPPLLFHQLLRNEHQTPTTCNALMRRDAVVAVGGFDSAFQTMFEDQVFFAKLELDYPVHVSGRYWAWYRQHVSATSANQSASAEHAAHRRYLAALARYLGERRSRFSAERLAVDCARGRLWAMLARSVRASMRQRLRQWLRR